MRLLLVLAALAAIAGSAAAATPSVATIQGPVNINEGDTGHWIVVLSNPPAGVLLTYTWSFGDGTHIGKTNDSTVDYAYTVPNSVAAGTGASYTVRVYIENTLKGAGNPTFQSSGEMLVRVLNTNPVISGILVAYRSANTLVPYNGQVAVGTNFQFQAEAYDVSGTTLSYSWLFGDCTQGASGSSAVYHQFHFPGVFTVTLQVMDPYGGYSLSSTQVTIECSPQLTNSTDDTFLNNGNCDLYAQCTKVSAGNYSCLCETGFMGDGFTCQRTYNPCLPGYPGYAACVVSGGNLECIPETLSAGLYTGNYDCSTCREGFYLVSGECRQISNPCEDYDSAASVTCRLGNGGRGLTCIPEIITMGDGLHEALYTGDATCGTSCPPGFVSVTAPTGQVLCQVVANPCSTGNFGWSNCTGLGYTTCVPDVTPDSAGSLYPLYTGNYMCGNDAQCAPGYSLTTNKTACVLIPNPCASGNAGDTVCDSQNRQCFPAFTLDTSGNTLYLGADKYSCGGCTTGYVETTIYDPTIQGNRQACALRPNPCNAGQPGAIDCTSDFLCLPVAVTSAQLFSGAYVCVSLNTLSCPAGYTTARDDASNSLVCVPTAAGESSDTARNVGIAVAVALVALLALLMAFIVLRRRRAARAKVSYNYAQKQEFDLMTRRMKQGVNNPMADIEGAEFDNPLADNSRMPNAFDNPMVTGGKSKSLEAQEPVVSGTLSAATALSMARNSGTGPRVARGAAPSGGSHARVDVDMNILSDQELMQLENPLYMTEEESDFTNPLARSATLMAKKKKAGGGAGPQGVVSAASLSGGGAGASMQFGDNPLAHASDAGEFSNPLRGMH